MGNIYRGIQNTTYYVITFHGGMEKYTTYYV